MNVGGKVIIRTGPIDTNEDGRLRCAVYEVPLKAVPGTPYSVIDREAYWKPIVSPCRALQCRCAFPGCPMPGSLRHQMTAYVHEASNWATLCFEHQRMADDFWRERWDDYYYASR